MATTKATKNYRHAQVRDRNPNWRGGRSVASNGYIIVRVGVGHHLADVRGYAYEHRLVAEAKIGRRLLPGECVHHIDHDKRNNAQSNIEVCRSAAVHRVHHRRPRSRPLRVPAQKNPVVSCKCGCGARFTRFDAHNRPRSYVSGHNLIGGSAWAA